MSDDLYIWLAEDMSGPWYWRCGDAAGLAGNDMDKTKLADFGAKIVSAVVPGQSVRMLTHDLPKMSGAEQRAAASFAIEDQIALPLPDQHIVLGPSQDKRIALITKSKMSEILSALRSQGLRPGGVYADFDVLQSDAPVLLPDRLIHPGPLGYALDRDWANSEQDEEHPNAVLARINTQAAVNLMTDEFAPKSAFSLKPAQMMRVAALLLAVGIVSLVLVAGQSRAVFKQADYIRAQTAEMYSDYTGQPAPANPALSVTRAVKNSGGETSDFLALSSLLFKALETSDGITVDTLQFDNAQNRLTLRLVYPRFESASGLEQSVRAAGGEFRSGGVREQGGRLIGDAVLSVGGGS